MLRTTTTLTLTLMLLGLGLSTAGESPISEEPALADAQPTAAATTTDELGERLDGECAPPPVLLAPFPCWQVCRVDTECRHYPEQICLNRCCTF